MAFVKTPSIIKDLGQIFKPRNRTSVVQAVEENVQIATPGGYAGAWSGDTTPYMKEPMNMMTSRSHNSVIFVGCARSGKALALDTPIATPTGWSTMGDLKVGDFVFGDDGEPVEIDLISNVMLNHDCYDIEFSDGSVITADGDHDWTVETFDKAGRKNKDFVKTVSTKSMIPDYRNGNRSLFAVKNSKSLNLPKQEFKIDPYILGYWLGDGHSNSARITCHVDDLQILQELTKKGHNAFVKNYDSRNPNVATIVIDPKPIEGDICFRGHDKRVTGSYPNGWCSECGRQNHMKRKYGIEPDVEINKHKGLSWYLHKENLINNKHIPQKYLRASYTQRIELLRGLMDSDGCCDNKGSSSYTTTIKLLANNVYELLMTFGIKARIRKRSHQGNASDSYTIDFTVYDDFKLFKLQRKLNNLKSSKNSVNEVKRRRIKKITKVDSVPVKCIRVKNDSHLYLAGESMIPTHNTQGLIDGGIGYIISTDPADALVVHMTEEAVRRYSRLRVSRMINNSPNLKAQMSPIAHDNNIMSKSFRNGTSLILGYPSPSQLSGMEYKYVFVSDYDRIPDDTGEGDVYTLALKRTQTFMSGGMCVVESSPGRDFTEASWKPKTVHDAPPVGGILGIYNTGDKRIWHWTCPDCHDDFPLRPGLDLFSLPEQRELVEILTKNGVKATAKEFSSIACPECGSILEHRHKTELNQTGFWKPETDQPNSIASYWLSGTCAKFQTWESMLEKEFNALLHFYRTGEEEKLKATRNTDQGIPYVPVGASEKLTADELQSRAEDLPERMIPDGARFLIASIDVQARKFVVQIHAYGVDLEMWIIDRFDIALSDRIQGGERQVINPASHKIDWNVLIDRVIMARYPLADESGRDMGIIMTVCDSGGKSGTTENAYSFWGHCKEIGIHSRFNLIKGERPSITSNKPMINKSILDKSSNTARKAKVAGQLPLWLLNTTLLKDAVSANLQKLEDGADRIHFPNWLRPFFYSELVAEIRTDKGWDNPHSARNETFDLVCYAKAGVMIKMSDFWKKELKWDNERALPAWAMQFNNNSEVSDKSDEPKKTQVKRSGRVRMKMR